MSDPLAFPEITPRYSLPMLFAGQAQKEVTVNEALSCMDTLLHAAIAGESATPPANPSPGETWLVASGGTGLWASHDGDLAAWTDGGWRFTAPKPGMRVFDITLGMFRHYHQSWTETAAPAGPQGGDVVDSQARQAIADLVATLCNAGIFSSG
ncbi:DUF2793 domain-containing protein [Novosphingobium sp. ZN18A2]|uniref:DUF2793 domain-containing protein n=1 Tax=Novosphingobium sp. ZN18A2 TaxID=3079861 RepID=UPI0030D043B6